MKNKIESLEGLYLYGVEHMSNGCEKARNAIKEIQNQATDKDVEELVKTSILAMDKALEIFDGIFKNHKKTISETQNKALTALGLEAKEWVLDNDFKHPALKDLAIVSKLRNLIHYPIAGFTAFIAQAKQLNFTEDLSLLQVEGKSVIDNKDALKLMDDLEKKLLKKLN